MQRRASLDWPLSREEKKGRVLELLDRDARAADHLLRVALSDFPKSPKAKPATAPALPGPIRTVPTPQRIRRKSLGDRPGCSADIGASNGRSNSGQLLAKAFGGDKSSDDEPREATPPPVERFRMAMANAAAAAFDALVGMAPAVKDAPSTPKAISSSKGVVGGGGASDGQQLQLGRLPWEPDSSDGQLPQPSRLPWEPAEEPECRWQATPTRARSEGRESTRRAPSALRGSRSLSRGHRRVSFADDDEEGRRWLSPSPAARFEPPVGLACLGSSSGSGDGGGGGIEPRRQACTRRNLSPLLDRASHAAAAAAADAVAQAAVLAAQAAAEEMASAAAVPAAGRRRADVRRARLRGRMHGYAQGSPTGTIGIEDAVNHLEGCERRGCMEHCMSPG